MSKDEQIEKLTRDVAELRFMVIIDTLLMSFMVLIIIFKV